MKIGLFGQVGQIDTFEEISKEKTGKKPFTSN